MPLECLLLTVQLWAAEASASCTIVLLDGSEVSGSLAAVSSDRLRLEDRKDPLSFPEIREIRFAAVAGRDSEANAPPNEDPAARAFLIFSGGEVLPGKILTSDGKSIGILVRGAKTEKEPAGESIGELEVPISAVRAFRLREALDTDSVFEETVARPAPPKDLLFARQEDHLLKLEGIFRGLDEDDVTIEHEGQSRRVRRSRILGAVLARVAPAETGSGYEGTLWLAGGGRLPVVLRSLEFRSLELQGAGGGEPRLLVLVHGAPWQVPLRQVARLSFATDRIQFLSDLEPNKVEEVPFLDTSFPYRRDASVGGGPLKLQGADYKKGLGVHSRSAIEYSLTDECSAFIARIGIDDSCGRRGGATVRVLGDGRELFKGEVAGGEKPLEAAVSLAGVKRLRLETDYGKDGVDFSDHVDWAEARLVKAEKTHQ